MPRYYCDYCDTYLTHDSPSVRKQHNAGYKHKANVRSYYQQFEEQQTQSLIDQKVKEHLGQTAAVFAQQQVGGAFHQHFSALHSGQYKPLPVPGLLPSSLPVPGAAPPLLPTIRPPVLAPPPGAPSGGYSGTPPTYRPQVSSTAPQQQPNGQVRPPLSLTPPGAPGVRIPASSAPSPASNGPLSSGPSGAYQQQRPPATSMYSTSYGYGPPPTSGSTGGYSQQRPNGTPSQGPNYSQQQQSSRGPPSGPSAQNNYSYGQPGATQGGQNIPNSFGPPPPGAPIGYRS